ncbi:MAG TPA: hypothetical protein VMW25_00545 [Clostridia bacterium]|nr:hypothetical protein [Clostridia bacterium]
MSHYNPKTRFFFTFKNSLAYILLLAFLSLSFLAAFGINTSSAFLPVTPPTEPTPTLPTTPPITPTATPKPTRTPPSHPQKGINWQTQNISLKADGFYIQIIENRKKFTVKNAKVSLHSDPGSPTYTSLETTWKEQGREMRLFIYFKSDGQYWWSDEIRTYDGQEPGEWVYYTGEFFKTEIGSTFTGNVKMISDPNRSAFNGMIYFGNLNLKVNFN